MASSFMQLRLIDLETQGGVRYIRLQTNTVNSLLDYVLLQGVTKLEVIRSRSSEKNIWDKGVS
jgi:hypothetical protein